MTNLLLSHSAELTQSLKSVFHHYKTKRDYVVYNVFEYAWEGWKTYVHKCAQPSARAMLIGINPGPHGMLQTGVPFGSISAVHNYLGVSQALIEQPMVLHPKRPIHGMSYTKEEQSGLLLWNTIASLFPRSQDFFSRCFVINYCPLAFFTHKAENMTPDKLTLEERKSVENACSTHLLEYLRIFKTSLILAVGRYAFEKVSLISSELRSSQQVSIEYIPHPSPLNRNRMEFAPALQSALASHKVS